MKKSLTKNYFYNLIYQLLVMVLPIIVTPFLSRKLGAQGIGAYSYTISIATYFVMLGSFGLSIYGQREIAKVQDDPAKRSQTFFELFCARSLTMIFAILIFFFLFCINNQNEIYFRILLLELFATILDISWFFQGLEDFKKITIRNLITKIISVIFIFTFVKGPQDVWIYLLIYALSNLFGNLLMYIDLKKYLTKPQKLKIFYHLKPMMLLLLPQIAIQIYTVLDKTMLGMILKDMNQVGYYEQAQKIIKLSLALVTTFGTVMIPRIANIFSSGNMKLIQENIKRSFRFVWLLATPIMFGLIAISQQFVPWFFGNDFMEVSFLIKIQSIIIIVIALENVLGYQYLVATNQQNKYTLSVFCAACVNILFNFILIPKYGSIGACVSSIIAEIVGLIIQIIYTHKIFSLKIIFQNSSFYLISSFIMFLIISLFLHFMGNTMVVTLLAIVLGIFVYGSLLLLKKDEFLIIFLKKFKLIKN